jgi:hypothetical protein
MRFAVLFALSLAACTALPAEDETTAADVEEIVSSGKDDPRFTAKLDRTWLLRGDGKTASDREVVVHVNAPASVTRIRAQIDHGRTVSATRDATGFTVRLPIATVATGEHTLLLAEGWSSKSFATRTFQITAPLYVVVSTDWDDTRFGDDKLRRMERLSSLHPEMLLTHFFAPFHYTDPLVSASRKQMFEDWIKRDRDTRKSEIGVHIHTWCHFVVAAGVKCVPQPAFAPNDDSGYVTILASYSESDMRAMLRKSREIFDEHDLGSPTSFRAGGWTADLSTLRALQAEGFTVDTSALPFKRIEEWRGFELYRWNEANWQGITETSQPYFPSATSLTSTASTNTLSVLEVPDNGILVDYVTGAEMIGIYEQNAPSGKALAKSTLFQVGYHPPNFSDSYLARLDQALGHVDKNLYSQDKGPAIYVTISELTKVWRR